MHSAKAVESKTVQCNSLVLNSFFITKRTSMTGKSGQISNNNNRYFIQNWIEIWLLTVTLARAIAVFPAIFFKKALYLYLSQSGPNQTAIFTASLSAAIDGSTDIRTFAKSILQSHLLTTLTADIFFPCMKLTEQRIILSIDN